uniref:Uncharacterized protein n=1 Tax=Dendroctonus ponderosae TaxID=77166 RepID=A0AAR5PKY8_DENPD
MFFRNSAEMGNILFPCRTDKNTSENVINLSQSCMERLIRKEKEVEKKYPEVQELQIPENLSEKEWMMKLKCLDDAHSNTYGLTVQAFYKLIDKVESQIEPVRPGICDPDKNTTGLPSFMEYGATIYICLQINLSTSKTKT